MCSLEKRGCVYILKLTGATEHRLNPSLLDSISDAISAVRSDVGRHGRGRALVTAAEGRFFCNGLDVSFLRASPPAGLPLLGSSLKRAVSSLLSLPIPTVAAVSGHAAAAGVGLVLAHDYVVMRSDRGVLYMSELDLGMPIPAGYFASLLREKIGDPRALRDVVLAGRKVTAGRGVEMGIVDAAVAGAEETVEAAVRMAEELVGARSGIAVEEARRAAFPETCTQLGLMPLDSKL